MSSRKRAKHEAGRLIEPLEQRQLMSLSVGLQLAAGGNTVAITGVGQVVQMELWATVHGTDANLTNEGLQDVVGSLISANVGAGAANGTLAATLTSPFDGAGSSSGTQVDLDGDGDLDIGSSDPAASAGFFFSRSASMITGSEAFKIADVTFTVTSVNSGTETDLNFVPRPAKGTLPSYATAVWDEDGVTKTTYQHASNDELGYAAGAPLTLTRVATNNSISGRVFNDLNANGRFDGTDTGISGFRVFLDKNDNGILDSDEVSKPVSQTGTYTFSSVSSGTYHVMEVFRSGWRQTFPALGYYQVTLTSGETAKSLSFANTDTVLIKGTVWMDANKDKKITPGEPGLPGWTLFLDQNNNGVLDSGEASTLTDANGNYRFFNLPAGKYVVRVMQASARYRLTAPASGSHILTLAAAGTKSNQNFGEKRLA